MKKKPHPIDVLVGSRIKMRRLMQGVSQEKLAEQLGVSFQQVQKYEKASNRVGAGRLHDIATFLKTDVSYFFDGANGFETQPENDAFATFMNTKEGINIARSFPVIKNADTRRQIAGLVQTIAGEQI